MSDEQRRKFKVTATIEAEVILSQKVFDNVDDEFREMIYDLTTDEEIAEHVCYNLVRGAHLSGLDGFANLEDFDGYATNIELYDMEVEEE